MNAPFSGQIIYNNVSKSRTVRRFIEKRIFNWLRDQGLVNDRTSGMTPRYFVTLQRDREGHGVNCRIEIDTGKNLWRSVEYASGLHQALIRGLNHLIPSKPPQPQFA
jgi:hypothetical protein